jgi:hypothetical protein
MSRGRGTFSDLHGSPEGACQRTMSVITVMITPTPPQAPKMTSGRSLYLGSSFGTSAGFGAGVAAAGFGAVAAGAGAGAVAAGDGAGAGLGAVAAGDGDAAGAGAGGGAVKSIVAGTDGGASAVRGAAGALGLAGRAGALAVHGRGATAAGLIDGGAAAVEAGIAGGGSLAIRRTASRISGTLATGSQRLPPAIPTNASFDRFPERRLRASVSLGTGPSGCPVSW